jgi:hypothetical protein
MLLVSTPASGGAAHMLTTSEQHFSTLPALPYLPAPFHPQYATAPNSTLMAPYSGAPRLPSAPAVPSLLWTATPTGAMHGGSSVGVSRAYALPSSDGRERRGVVTGTISVDSFDAYTLFDSGTSFSFVSDAFVARACLFRQKISQTIVVNSAKGFIFNWLKKLINKTRALGSKKWTNCMLTERLMMAYTPMNYNVVALIRQDLAYKKMTSDDVLGRIMNHEMNIQEDNNINNLYKGISTSKK